MRGTRCCGVLISPTPQTQTKKKKSMFPKFGKSKKKADAADAPPPVPEAEPAKAPTPPPPGMREDATPIPVLSESLGKPWLLYVPFWCPENVYSSQFRWLRSYNPEFPQYVFAEPHPDDAEAFYR